MIGERRRVVPEIKEDLAVKMRVQGPRIVETTDPSFRLMGLDQRRRVVVVFEMGIVDCNVRSAHGVDALASMRKGER